MAASGAVKMFKGARGRAAVAKTGNYGFLRQAIITSPGLLLSLSKGKIVRSGHGGKRYGRNTFRLSGSKGHKFVR